MFRNGQEETENCTTDVYDSGESTEKEFTGNLIFIGA